MRIFVARLKSIIRRDAALSGSLNIHQTGTERGRRHVKKNHHIVEGHSSEKSISVQNERFKQSDQSKDVLAIYYETISKTPRLSLGEEIRLAKRTDAGRQRIAVILMCYQKKGVRSAGNSYWVE